MQATASTYIFVLAYQIACAMPRWGRAILKAIGEKASMPDASRTGRFCRAEIESRSTETVRFYFSNT